MEFLRSFHVPGVPGFPGNIPRVSKIEYQGVPPLLLVSARAGTKFPLLSAGYWRSAPPSCRIFARHWAFRDWARAELETLIISEASKTVMSNVTRSSIRVKPPCSLNESL